LLVLQGCTEHQGAFGPLAFPIQLSGLHDCLEACHRSPNVNEHGPPTFRHARPGSPALKDSQPQMVFDAANSTDDGGDIEPEIPRGFGKATRLRNGNQAAQIGRFHWSGVQTNVAETRDIMSRRRQPDSIARATRSDMTAAMTARPV
jgi:hypothetical protein